MTGVQTCALPIYPIIFLIKIRKAFSKYQTRPIGNQGFNPLIARKLHLSYFHFILACEITLSLTYPHKRYLDRVELVMGFHFIALVFIQFPIF